MSDNGPNLGKLLFLLLDWPGEDICRLKPLAKLLDSGFRRNDGTGPMTVSSTVSSRWIRPVTVSSRADLSGGSGGYPDL